MSDHGTLLRSIGIALGTASALLLGFAAPVRAGDTVYVSNIGKSTRNRLELDDDRFAQKFTTGSASGGYALKGVELNLSQAPGNGTLTVTIRGLNVNTDPDTPGSIVHTLTNPLTVGDDAQMFQAPLNARLDGNKSYFVHIVYEQNSGDLPKFKLTGSYDQNSEIAEDGWEIDNRHFKYYNGDQGLTWYSSGSAVFKIRILGENAPPTSVDKNKTTNEDESYAFSFQKYDEQPAEEFDFRFNDINTTTEVTGDSADSLQKVIITELPGKDKGKLTLNGTDITSVPQEVSKADLDDEDFIYTPPENANGTSYASFKFKVNDGDDDSTDEYTFTISVDPVNDPPTVEYRFNNRWSKNVNLNEDASRPAHIFAVSDFGFMDADTGDELEKITITSLPGPGMGTLKLNGTDIVSVPKDVSKDDLRGGDHNHQERCTIRYPVSARSRRRNSDGRLTFSDWCDHRHGNKLTYTPPANVNGLVEFKFMVNDGDADSISEYPFVIKMTAVNDPPIVSDSNVETDEDTPHPFVVSDFGFTDVDSDTTIPQDTYLNATLQSITITSLPGTGKGTLGLNNQTITDLNQIVTKSQLEAGALKYHPPLNANGNHFASFQFKANDGMDDSTNTATMTITVKPKNDAPEAEDDDFEIDANTSLNELDVLENDRDLNGDSLSITVKTTPSHGTATIDSSGSRSVISYSPDLNFIGTDTFNYTISDGQDPPLTDTAAVTVTVVPKLEGPDSSDFAAPAEAELLVSNMEQGDDSNHYPRGSRIIYQQFTTGNNRRGYDVKSVTLRFKANVPTIQRDFKFEIREGIPQSTRICTLGKPSSRMRGDRTFSAGDCPNLDKNKSYYLTIITSQSDKLVRVSSNREASGKASGWSISDGSRTLSGGLFYNHSESLKFSMKGEIINTLPTAEDGLVEVTEDTAYSFAATDFNFSDLDNDDALDHVTIVTLPTDSQAMAQGTLALNGVAVTAGDEVTKQSLIDSKLTYTPPANANGDDYASFKFKVNDGTSDSESAYIMSIDIDPRNDKPIGQDGTVTTDKNTAYSFTVADFGFMDVDADELVHLKITSLAGEGSLSLDDQELDSVVISNSNPVELSKEQLDDGLLIYTPPADRSGSALATFSFKLNDGELDSDPQTISIDVKDEDIVENENVVWSGGTEFFFSENDDISNRQTDTNPVATITVTAPEGEVFTGAGRLYQDENGNDNDQSKFHHRFLTNADNTTYQISFYLINPPDFENPTDVDGNNVYKVGAQVLIGSFIDGSRFNRYITITVTDVNEAPVAVKDTTSTAEDTVVDIDVLENDTDLDDLDNDMDEDVKTTLSVIRVGTENEVDTATETNPANGTAVWDPSKELVTYTPDDNFNGTDTFTYVVSDGELTAVGTVSVTVNAVNDPPVAENSDDETAALLFTPSSLTLVGGGSGSYTVALASQPTAAVTVSITSGSAVGVTLDADAATNGNQNSLSFTTTNWSTPQTVNVSVGQDIDDTVTLSHSASGGDYGSVTANLRINVQNICERMDALSSNGKTCNLSSKKITSLNSGDFDGLSNLQKLYLNNNKLSGLPEDVFNGLSKLRNLRLSNNALSSLPEDIFAGLSKLQNLRLHNNALSSLPEDIFAGLSKLQNLRLHNNDLSSLPEDIFAGLSKLQNFRLHNNTLSSLPEDIFTGLSDLETLNLNGNSLICLPRSLTLSVQIDVELPRCGNLLTLTPSSLTVAEGGSSSYTVALASEPTATVTVSLSSGSGVTLDTDAATDGNQNSLSFTTSNWNTPQTVAVSGEQDDDEVDDTVVLSHTASGGDYIYVTANLSVTVIDDDKAPALVFTPENLTVAEARSGSYTVRLAGSPSAAVTVTVSAGTDAGMTLDTDAASDGNQNSLSFTTTNWSTPQTVDVSAGQDDDAVDDTVTLSHSASGGDYGSVTGDLLVTVADDDKAPALVLTPESLTLAEGGSGSYTVALAGSPSAAVTVTVSAGTGVTLDTDADTSGNQTSLNFSAANWNTPQMVDVSAEQDDDAVDDTVTLSHSASGGDYGSIGADLVVTVSDDEETTNNINTTAASTPLLMASGTLEPLTLYVGGEDGSRDGHDGFIAGTVNNLIFTFQSSDPTVASVKPESPGSSIVMVTPVREGKATITVTATATATSGNRISDRASFPVTVVTSPAEETAIRAAFSGQGRVVLGSVTDMIGERLDSGTAGTGASGSVCLSSAAGTDGESGSSGTNAIAGSHGSHGESSDYLIAGDTWQGDSWNTDLAATGLRGVPHVGQRDEDSMDKTFDDLLELFRGRPHSLHPADWGLACGTGAVGEVSRPWTLWAGTDLQWARGGTETSNFDGEWQLYYLGADRAFAEQWLGGLSLSRVWGDVDYSFEDATTTGAGQLSSSLTAIYPYLHGQLSSNLELWAIGGFGFGDVENEREHVDGDADQGDLQMRLLSLGLRRSLSQVGSAMDLALSSDAGFVTLSADGDGSLDGAEASMGRFRLGLELSRPFANGVEPFAQLHGRYDSGDGPTGAAGELVLGLRYGDERFNLELRGNHLTSAADFEQWGAKARLDYGPATDGTGLNLALTSQWGAAENGDSFLDGHTMELPTPALVSAQGDGGSAPAEISGEIGYSLSMGQQWGSLTPNLGYDHSGNGSSRSRVGLAYALSSDLDRGDIELRLDLARRERRQEDPDHSIELGGSLRF